ncbi:pre-B-cell leukemia transcription factor-interacting protein 1 isoform X3 [Phyllobates terribilis]|uniref:pre-B-cell leukemia transcription factor-interacting protein 1 isoform X3 n=1 Tax=Phyllobates terribilis TaxID=111132 RepID=UPI003CCB51E8
MSEGHEGRDSENNWVIPSAESFPVETVGAAQDGADDEGAAASKPPTPPDKEETAQPPDVKPGLELGEGPTQPEEPRTEEPQRSAEEPVPAPDTGAPRVPSTVASCFQKLAQILPEPLSLGVLRSWGPCSANGTGGDLEEVSCSSSDDDVEGLRKRVGRGAPPISAAPCAREAIQQDTDAGSSMNLNTLFIAAIGLLCIGLLVFSGSIFSTDEDPPQTVVSRSVKGGDKQPPQVIADIQRWIEQHTDQFTGDTSSLQVMSGLLDKVAKENQDIRHMQANLQAQKEELEALLSDSEGVNATSGPQHPAVTEENVRLKEALLKEETAHLSAKEELQTIQEKLEVLESIGVEKESLLVENSQLKVELDALRSQIEGFLPQKETLVAESQMLRQELDKQRLLVTSIRQDLDNLVTKSSEGEDEKLLRERISEMSSKLAMEAQRSETWEKKYVEHAQKRKEHEGEERRDHHHKEWKRMDKFSKSANISSQGGDFKKPHYKHGKRWTEESHRESKHEEWKSKKQDDGHWRDKKHRHWEGVKAGDEVPEDKENWKSKAREHKSKDSAHYRHHQGESDEGFHPRKGQRDFTDRHKRQEDGDKGKNHRHHDHNKFWKKLSDHQYRVPEGCSGLEDCARKDGVDLFKVELKPVQRKHFEEILLNFLTKSQLSQHLPELTPLLDGFFEGPLFSHHKIRFKDFVDDVEDFLEDLAIKETGDDDVVDDFERYVYTSFFGEAATKKRFAKKDEQWKTKHHKQSGKLETYGQGLNSSDDLHQEDNQPFRTDHHVDCRDFKCMKMPKTGPSNTPNEDEPDHKFEMEDKHNPKTHHRLPKYNDHAENEKKSKYPQKSSGGQHNDHHIHKPYEENGDWQKHHEKYNPNSDKKQKSPDEEFRIDSYKYKSKNPNKSKEETERKHWPKKTEKDANNKRYQSPQSYGDHHDHKPWRDGDHLHGQSDSDHKFYQGQSQHYSSKSYYHEHENDGRCTGYHYKSENEQDNYQKQSKDKPGNYHKKHDVAKDRHWDYHNMQDKDHKHRDDRDGDYHKHDKDHKHRDDKDGDYHKHDKDHKHRDNKDGDYHKHDKDHKHRDDKDGDYHKHDKDHKHRDDKDGDYHKHDKDHKHRDDKDGDYHKHDKDNKYGDDKDGDYHKHDKDHKHRDDRDGDYDKDHKHRDDRDGDYDKDHKHRDDRDGDYDKDHKHRDDRDGDYHKHDKDHKHRDDRDGDYHKHEKDHKHRDDRDGVYDKDHKHRDNRDGDYHKHDKDHKHRDDRDGDYHKHDKDHKDRNDRDGDYHKHDKDHKHRNDRDGDYHKHDKDHKHRDDRDGDYHKHDKDHKHRDDKDGDYHKHDKDLKHRNKDRDHKYDEDHHNHGDCKDKHSTRYKLDEERRPRDYHHKHNDNHNSPRKY